MENKHLRMVCPHCGATCNVALNARWTGDVFLHWDKECDEAQYDIADSTLDYEDYEFVCDCCGKVLFDSWPELEDHFRKARKHENSSRE